MNSWSRNTQYITDEIYKESQWPEGVNIMDETVGPDVWAQP